MARPIAVVAAAVLSLGAALAAHAQTYPSKPVKIIVPYGAGGPADIYARFLAQRLQEPLGLPEVKEAWLKQGAVPLGMTVDQFDRFLRDEIVKWAKVVKVSGAKVD